MKLDRIYINREEIAAAVKATGSKIAAEYKDKDPVAVVLLKGGYIFASDITRAMDIDMSVDFMIVSSYGSNTESSGELLIKKDILTDICNRHVIIIDDIMDSGLTALKIKELFKKRGAQTVRICVFLNKPAKRTNDIEPDYSCFDIDDHFVAGYGMDLGEKYRNLPDLWIVK